jgi:prepilin-type N-terminal cleavage/methylation domain-containing protein
MLLTPFWAIVVKNKTYCKTYKSSAGFTLIELLVAASITTIVVSVAGSGLVAIMQNNGKAESETLRRTELNRALDFITEEIRIAKKIELNAATATGYTFTPQGSDVQKILALEVPTAGGSSRKVVYYIATPPATSVWSGPKVIYRWGPEFNGAGQYSTAANTNKLLLDFIDSSPITPSCQAGWSVNPSSSSTGFYACVASNSRSAEIYLHGKLTDAYGNSRDPLQVSSTVFARHFEITALGGGSHFGAIPGGGGGGGAGNGGGGNGNGNGNGNSNGNNNNANGNGNNNTNTNTNGNGNSSGNNNNGNSSSNNNTNTNTNGNGNSSGSNNTNTNTDTNTNSDTNTNTNTDTNSNSGGQTTPATPTGLIIGTITASGNNLTIPVSWNSVSNATSYQIYSCIVGKNDSDCTPTIESDTGTATSKTYSLSNANNKKVCYTVKATNSAGSSSQSSSVCKLT